MACKTDYKHFREENPYAKASIFSKLTFLYLHPIITKGFKQPLEKNDIYATLNDYKSSKLIEQFKSRWANEFRNSKLGLLSCILKLYSPLFFLYGVFRAVVELVAALYIPYCVGQLLLFYESSTPKVSKRHAYGSFIQIIICLLVRQLTITLYSFKANEIIIKIKAYMNSLIYRKIVNVANVSTLQREAEGLINLLSNDVNCFDLLYSWVDIWKSIVIFLSSCIYMYFFIGPGAIVGVIITMLLMPIQYFLQRRTTSVTEDLNKATNIRLRFMTEIISGIQTVKINRWEYYITNAIDLLRMREISNLHKIYVIRAIMLSTVIFGPVAILGTVMANKYFGHDITASKIFPAMIILNYLTTHIIQMFPDMMSSLLDFYNSIKKVESFLHNVELDRKEKCESSTKSDNSERSLKINVQSRTKSLIISNASIILGQKNELFKISDVNIEIIASKPCVIYGSTNCGSSTLVNAIIGEFELDQGKIEINGLLSYASDQLWIVNGTIQKNIILDEEFDEDRYQKVCQICILDNDFNKLELGENTMINECTDIITEEQKSRISLARCIYKIADIYLFDFILEETDINFGKLIWKECIRFLKNKCVILTTNCDQYLSNVDHIVTMDCGVVTNQGKYEEVIKTLKEMTEIENHKSNQRLILDANLEDIRCGNVDHENARKRIALRINLETLFRCVTKICNAKFIATVFIICVLERLLISFHSLFLVRYFNEQNSHHKMIPSIQSAKNMSFIVSFTFITFLVTIFIIIRNFSFESFLLKFSKKINQLHFQSILQLKLSFFKTVPLGKILQRYIKDSNTIDKSLPIIITDIVIHFMEFITILIIISVTNLWLALPSFVLLSLMFFTSFVVSNIMRDLTQHRINANQTIQNQMIETVQNISSIRLMNAHKIMEDTFQKRVDLYSSVTFIQNTIITFVDMCVNLAFIGYVAIVIVSFIFPTQNEIPTYKCGSVGLSITLAIFLLGFLEWGIEQLTQLQFNTSTIHGFADYNSLREQSASINDLNITNDWPGRGAIEFSNVHVRDFQPRKYSIKNFTLSIKPKGKIRLIDLTGKINSAIIQSIFRLNDFEGLIQVDRINIKHINLNILRRRISFIAQDPIIFSGTIRDNIDPFQEFKDNLILTVLRNIDLKSVVLHLPDGIKFNFIEGRTVLSLEQRFLITLTRVILMQNKIIIIDFPPELQCTAIEHLLKSLINTQLKNSTVIICYQKDRPSEIKFDHAYRMELNDVGECTSDNSSTEILDNKDEDIKENPQENETNEESMNTTTSQLESSITTNNESEISAVEMNTSENSANKSISFFVPL